MPTDSDTDVEVEVETSAKDSSASKVSELERRLAGQTRSVDRLQKELKDAKDKLADKDADRENELSQLRVAKSDLEKKVKDTEASIATTNDAKKLVEQERDKLKFVQDSSKVIADKFPALLADHLLGDLKLRSDFGTDEEYAAYLERQAKKLGTPASQDKTQDKARSIQDQMRGATPSAAVRIQTTKAGVRHPDDIADDLYNLNGSDAKYAEKRIELLKELNEATSVA